MYDIGVATWFKKVEDMHPYQTLVYLGMFGSGLIFLYLSIAFVFSFQQQFVLQAFRVPISFLASLGVMVVSGVAASKLLDLYIRDEFVKLKEMVLSMLLLGLIFTLLQLLGWLELQNMGVRFKGVASESYLFLLTGIHAIHLLGALVFAGMLYAQLKLSSKDAFKSMLFMINPFEKMKIRLFVIYWYFMDVIWVVLFLLIFASFS
ncbi:cytochrome C oxidase subunit III [Litoribacter ruber]|uniref:Cytochrome C oxidase subunit III n=1 Tax=Litoribacter ruber TaxID=702568 RepID=A0AAP2CF97_9BACT|nr:MULTISPECIES: cytochrome C oxidase subunit III [Litoribacter]MBS9523501.1 cytochrome C oxidase subunit III [Litoribacter alkaliphilus]MBT0812082.1 cytochrome C oxidase subunit III [Litoribacter ruber]